MGNGIFQPFPVSLTFDSIHYITGGYCLSMSYTALPKLYFRFSEREAVELVYIERLFDGLNISMRQFFDSPLFDDHEQEL